MKRSVALTLVALFILATTAFGQGIRIEKKVEKKAAAAPATEVIEQEIEIEIELEDGEEDLDAVIEDLKELRERIRKAKNAGDLEKVAEELKKARVRVESSREVIIDTDGRRHLLVTPKVQGDGHGPFRLMGRGVPGTVIQRVIAGTPGAPAGCPHCAAKSAPKCACQNCAPRPAPNCGCQGHAARPAPKCGCQGQGGRPRGFSPMPQPPRHAGFDDGLRHSLDALRGEIAGLRAEMRAMRGQQHATAMGMAVAGKAVAGKAGAFEMSGVAPGAYRIAMKHPPAPPKPVAPSKGVVVKRGNGAAGGFVFGAVPAKKPDPRQAHLEKEVADLKKEMGHMKAMMHEMLKKMDDMQKAEKK